MKKICKLLLLMMVVCLSIAVFTGCDKNKQSAVDSSSIKYDGTKITWTAPEGATKYNITVNDKSFNPTSNSQLFSAAKYDEVAVSIVAVNSNGVESEPSSKTFIKLDNVPNISFDENGVMTWGMVDGADCFELSINDKVTKVSDCEYSDFEIGKQLKIKIKASTSDGSSFSSYSSVFTKTYLAAPTKLKYDGEYLSWTGSTQAVGYKVYIDGSTYQNTTGTRMAFDAEERNFSFSVKAEGDGSTVFASAESEEKSYSYLATPTEFSIANGIVTWDEIAGATGYEVIVDNGTKFTVKTNSYDKLSAGTQHRIKVRPITTDTDVYFTFWSNEHEYKILATPTTMWDEGISLDDGLAKNNFSWNPVSGDVGGYSVRITFNGSEKDVRDVSDETNSYAYDFKDIGEYTICVKAIAEQNSTVCCDSSYSKEIKVIRLAAPNPIQNGITSDKTDITKGFSVKFDRVYRADSYKLYKNNNNTAIQTTSNLSFDVTDIVERSVTDVTTVLYKIQSIGSVKTVDNQKVVILNSLFEKSYQFEVTVLSAPTNYNIEASVATWDGNIDASGYGINYGKVTITNDNSFTLKNLEVGEYQVSICNVGNGKAILPSNYTGAKTVRKLACPTNIKIGTDPKKDEGKLTWTNVEGAQSYEAKYGTNKDAVKVVNEENINDKITTEGITVNVRAVADYKGDNDVYYISSEFSPVRTFIKLATLTFKSQKVSETKLIWNRPTNAPTSTYRQIYQVYDGHKDLYSGTVQDPEFDLSDFDAGTHVFYVRAIGDGETYINSDFSEAVSIKRLETPVVTKESKKYTWNGVSSATSYVLYIDGKVATSINHTGMIKYEYELDLTKFATLGQHSVQLFAIGDDGYETFNSKANDFKQMVDRLNQPELTITYSDTCYNPNGKIIIDSNTITYANGYTYVVGGSSSVEQKSTHYEYATQATGLYKVKVSAVGGNFDDKGTLMIQSLETTQEIQLLEKPSGITLSRDGELSFTPITNCSSYKIVVHYTEASGIENAEITTTVNTANVTNSTSVDYIEIQAMGKGSLIINSAVATYTRI